MLAVALAACWLAHPPTATWLTLVAGLLRLVTLIQYPSWRALGSLFAAAMLAGVLSPFVFVSVFTLNDGLTMLPDARATGVVYVADDGIVPGRLPRLGAARVAGRGSVGRLQLGYVSAL